MKKKFNMFQLFFVVAVASILMYFFTEYNQIVPRCLPALETTWSEIKSIYYHENFRYLVMLIKTLLFIRKKPS